MMTTLPRIEYLDDTLDDEGNHILGFLHYTSVRPMLSIRLRVPMYASLPSNAPDGNLIVLRNGNDFISYMRVWDEWADMGKIELEEVNPFEVHEEF